MNCGVRLRVFLFCGVLLCFVALLLAPKAVSAGTLASYTAYMNKFTPCDASETKDGDGSLVYITTSKYDVQRQNILQTITGNVTVGKSGITNAMWTRARLDSKLHAHWADNAYTFNFPDKTCSHGRTHMPGVWSVMFRQDLRPRRDCVVQPGVYTFENEPINWTFPKFPIMPLGTWTFHITFGEGKTTHMCTNVDVRTVAKK